MMSQRKNTVLVWLTAGLLLGVLAAAAFAAERSGLSFEQFMASRKVLATVYFDVGSARLDDDARATLERLAPQIKSISFDEKVLRIEGFSSPEGKELANVLLSMERAASVELYLRKLNGTSYERYLVGKGVYNAAKLDNAHQRRVDIAIYDNVLNIDWDKSDRIVIDGRKK